MPMQKVIYKNGLISDAPVCSKDSEITVIGASLDETIKIRCQVAADPGVVSFVWQFNNSGENFDVAPARFSTSSGNTSELMYTPASQRHYGTLTCWGTNPIGKQMDPCIFQVSVGWFTRPHSHIYIYEVY